ncbi:MAG: hypothetical protein WD037_03705 [Balneolales bacterium]
MVLVLYHMQLLQVNLVETALDASRKIFRAFSPRKEPVRLMEQMNTGYPRYNPW